MISWIPINRDDGQNSYVERGKGFV